MPAVLVTPHAYRSWSEADARGYLQHGRGLQPTNDRLAKWREEHALQPPNRFDLPYHDLLHNLAADVCKAENVTLHAASVTPTHLHLLISFSDARCNCHVSEAADVNPRPHPQQPRRYHPKTCPAWQRAHRLAVRLKRVAGGKLSTATAQPGRKWFSRGEDISPVRDRAHYTHHLQTYLPKHAAEGGTVRVYDDRGAARGHKPTD